MSQEKFEQHQESGKHSIFQEFSSSEEDKLAALFERVGFDFNTLQSILEKYLEKSGVEDGGKYRDFSMLHVVDVKFDEIDKGRREATADLIKGIVSIDAGLIEEQEQQARKILEDSPVPKEKHQKLVEAFVHYKLLKNLIHEYVHIRGHVHIENGPDYVGIDAGYAKRQETLLEDGVVEQKNSNVSLSEAVTEKMALEIYQEYAHRAGATRQAYVGKKMLDTMEEITKIVLEQDDLGGYDNIVETLDIILEHIADEAELQKEIVWNAFKQGYFAGLPEITNLLSELSGFLKEEFPQMVDAETNSNEWNPMVFRSKLSEWEANRGKTLAEEMHI